MARTRQTVAAAWVLTATWPGSTSLTSVSVTFAPTSTSLEMRASRLLLRQVRTCGADAGEKCRMGLRCVERCSALMLLRCGAAR